jgi:alpha-beta hydrolase superfamily lysophospholipase
MRQYSEHTFCTNDGTPLFYRHWRAAAGPGGQAILLLHRGHEHSGRLQHLVDELNLPDCTFFAFDARGHGLSPGQRGFAPGISTLVKDLDVFVRSVILPLGFPIGNLVVVAQSVGSVIAATWVHDYAPGIRCIVLAAPAFRIKLYIPFARPALAVAHKVFGDFTVTSYVTPGHLTHDPERIADFRSDPLITRAISVRVLLDLHNTAARVIQDAAAIRTPVQLLISGSDRVVRKQPQLEFFNRLGSATKEVCELKGFFHDTLGELDRRLAIGKARAFILKMFSQPCDRPSLLNSDHQGASFEEFEQLRRPLRHLSPRAIGFSLVRTALGIGGCISDGIRLGIKTGFDSGATLDYVYRNHSSGITPLGRLVDHSYLNSIGWRGIRARKQHVEQLLIRVADDLHASSQPVRVVDIAAGYGRYVLDALGGRIACGDQILLRDYSAPNVDQAKALITQRSLAFHARAECGDAFDRASLAAIEPQPTVAVVSGLYELLSENGPVRDSLGGLADAVLPGGYLIYTGQPWHPQLELIARTLRSHRDNQPWIMRRRTQAELDQLVGAAGFQKIDQLTDKWGIFTVSLARRVTA